MLYTKIWYQSSTPLGNPELKDYERALKRHINSIKRPDVEIDFHGVEVGVPYQEYNFVVLLNRAAAGGVFNKIIQAEREGYDAVAIGCFLDPALYEAREVVNIPVLSLGETSMYVACMLGRRFSVVIAFHEKQTEMCERTALSYGLRERMVPFHGMGLGISELVKGLREPKNCIEKFREVAEKAVKAGAEVIIPGCGILDLILVKNNIREIDGAFVLPIDSTLVKFTEAMMDLNKLSGVKVSRKLLFKSPTKDILNETLRVYGLK